MQNVVILYIVNTEGIDVGSQFIIIVSMDAGPFFTRRTRGINTAKIAKIQTLHPNSSRKIPLAPKNKKPHDVRVERYSNSFRSQNIRQISQFLKRHKMSSKICSWEQ